MGKGEGEGEVGWEGRACREALPRGSTPHPSYN